MTKLYELSFIPNNDATTISLSYSFEIEKLMGSVPCDCWMVMTSHKSKRVRQSPDNIFPKYYIEEVNFIV